MTIYLEACGLNNRPKGNVALLSIKKRKGNLRAERH